MGISGTCFHLKLQNSCNKHMDPAIIFLCNKSETLKHMLDIDYHHKIGSGHSSKLSLYVLMIVQLFCFTMV